MAKYRFWTIIFLAIALWGGFFVVDSEKSTVSDKKFKFGLDLSGGTHLVYIADTKGVLDSNVGSAMQSLRDTIERRVNLFGVAEPLVQIEEGSVFGGNNEQRLIVELPGVTDVDEAVRRIGETPVLEFRILNEGTNEFSPTGLTGRLLEKAEIQFDQNFQNKPIVGLRFNKEGADLFAKITRENTGKVLGVFLDGTLIEAPYIREEITGGEAVITGDFTIDQAKKVVRDLNYGALPMPVSLASTETIGASLGEEALQSGVKASLVGMLFVSVFMVLWYRVPGLVSVGALSIYVVTMLVLFKSIPVTITTAGIAGLIISVGMAIDANVIVFERMKEELNLGRSQKDSTEKAFAHAWSAIRDGNISTILGAIILFWFGTSSVEGFALVLGIGTIVSMFSSMVVSRTFMLSLPPLPRFLMDSGLYNNKK
jgi:protein-export SecD/SecF family membrane protein